MKDGERNPLISVLIPTYNRAHLLKKSLESLKNQSISKDLYEVVVVNDGSTDDTEWVSRSYSNQINLKYVFQENSGISAAKNLAIFVSEGPIILFFDDDDVADYNLLKEHLRFHNEYRLENFACLGYTTWHPSVHITPVMKYVTDVGQFLFSYNNLKDGQELDFTYFWGGRTSCKRSFLVKHGIFNQDFRYIIEDIELGFRLVSFGLRVIFNRQAKSFMIRQISYEQFCQRCERQGRALFLFSLLHPYPVVQRYCMVDGADEKWKEIEPKIEEMKDKVHAIEISLLSSGLSDQKRNLLTKELYELYEKSFRAFQLKGIVEAKREMLSQRFVRHRLNELSANDLAVFKSRWEKLPRPSKRSKRVLVLDHLYPMYDRASGSLRIFNILKLMRELGYDVTFIAMSNELENIYRPVLEELGIENYVFQHFKKFNVFDIGTFSQFFRERDFNFVIIEFWNLAKQWIPMLRKLGQNVPLIVDSVDIHFVRELREAELAGDKNLIKKALENKEQEIHTYRQADRVWVVTENDKNAIEKLIGDIPIDIVPNVHEKIDFIKRFEETRDLVFVGNFRHAPNRDAVFYLCNEIFPLIKETLKDVKLFVIGNSPQEDVMRLASEDIIVTGYVEDLSPYLKKARVSVAPLRYGAGMKGKIGEALSFGLPVVTTSIGAEGMGLTHGVNVLIGDDKEKFANEVIRVYRNREVWETLSANGKRFIEDTYSPEAVKKRLSSIFLSMEIGRRFFEKPIEIKKEKIEFIELGQNVGMASIIVLAKDNWPYTRTCIESLTRYTDVPYEIVLVDNGSIRSFLNDVVGWKDKGKIVDIKYLRSLDNLGFAGGFNRGIEVSKGEYIVILNNDTIVTPGWLRSLLKPLVGKKEIGITGPMSNYVYGAQMIQNCPLKFEAPHKVDFGILAAYATKIREENKNKYIRQNYVIGLCMAIKREVIEKIGGFDERFYPGNFEDDDFCIRVQRVGYETLICCESFVYHFGNRTFINERLDYELSIVENERKLMEKWGIPRASRKDELIEKALYVNATIERLIFPLCNDTFFIMEWDKKHWKKKFDYYLTHPYSKAMQLIVYPNGENLEFIKDQMESYIKEMGLSEFPDIVLFDGQREELLNGLEGKKYLILTKADLARRDIPSRSDIFSLFA
ncbi:MAG: glycosyltransferase [Deltaproteobacteria bacterium]|nr:glycosyltransferase [Deltaproteobacteria bacterium]